MIRTKLHNKRKT